MKTPCIAYKIPLYELDRAAQGVSIEQLDKLTEPKVFIPDPNALNCGFSKQKRKA